MIYMLLTQRVPVVSRGKDPHTIEGQGSPGTESGASRRDAVSNLAAVSLPPSDADGV